MRTNRYRARATQLNHRCTIRRITDRYTSTRSDIETDVSCRVYPSSVNRGEAQMYADATGVVTQLQWRAKVSGTADIQERDYIADVVRKGDNEQIGIGTFEVMSAVKKNGQHICVLREVR